MNCGVALTVALVVQSGSASSGVQPLPASSPILQEARARGLSVAACLPKQVGSTGLPARQDALDAWTQADWRFRRGEFVFLAQGSQDFLPRDFVSLESRQYTVMRNVRTLLSYHVNAVSPTSFVVAPSIGKLPKATQEALLDDVFTGHSALPKDADQAGCGLTIRPGYIFTDPNTRREATYALDRLPANAYAGQPVPPLQRDNQLELFRANRVESLKASLPADRLPLESGVYLANDLLARSIAGSELKLRLDKRFQDRRILLVLAKPPSRIELLHAISQSLDLYPRNLGSEWFLGVSPGDPREFYRTKREIEMRNCMIELLKACYRSGTIPSYIPPETFLQRGTRLSSPTKARLYDDLKKAGVLAFGTNVLGSGKGNVDLDRFAVTGYVSICLSQHDKLSQTSSCATYP